MNKIYAEILEKEALVQFKDALAQPFAVRGALMPDAHTGYSLPIGAVVATKDYIVPSWVGYDIGCTDMDTEYLTINGWKKISEYNNEDIMVYNVKENSCDYEKPNAYIINECKEFHLLDNKVVNQCLTKDHKLLMFGAKSNYPSNILLKDAIIKNKTLSKGYSARFKTTIPIECNNVLLYSDNEIRLILAIQANGCIRKSGKIEFHLKKQRKIDRLLGLLKDMNITPNISNIEDNSFGCSFQYEYATKDLSMFYKASNSQLKVLIDEIRYWDGHIKEDGRITYSSTSKTNIDVVQYAFATQDIRANYHKTVYDNGWKSIYQLYTTNNNYIGFPKEKDITVVSSKDGKSYCFNTSTGYWIMRRGGKISITGNCGMCALKLEGIAKEDIINKDNVIFDNIYRYIPVGFNINETDTQYPVRDLTQEGLIIAEKKKFRKALGSLGGGNHFIEVGTDSETDEVWVIIHSGSRGVGHAIATHYMKVAQTTDEYIKKLEEEFYEANKDCYKYNPTRYNQLIEEHIEKKINNLKPKDGHNGFSVYSKHGKDYIKDMNWALGYALANRKEMMRRVVNCVTEALDISCYELDFSELINRNHNHAVYDINEKVWIHRKGATHAEVDMLGVIPGNMRDGSFIVRGKGNRDSLNSSSHGAGRVLSRKAAKENLNLFDFQDTMGHIQAKIDYDTLDESPFAYKDIYEVMRLQEDLVDIIAHIKPLINIKG